MIRPYSAFALVLCLFLALPTPAAPRGGQHVAAATESALATAEAMRQLAAGGNAVDAAIAAALVAGVANPSSSGIGGGGFALVWLASSKECHLIDFRELSPRRLDRAAFEQRPFGKAKRGMAVGVPGELLGLHGLARKFATKPWAELVRPAARIARQGFAMHPHLARALGGGRGAFAEEPALADLYLKGDAPRARVVNAKLARTLERVAAEGPAAFYTGNVAADLVRATQAAGGALGADDLATYRPRWREPLKVSWEARDVYTMPPPSAGGLMLAQVLGSYSSAELRALGFGSDAYVHRVAEVMRGALADRLRYVGDPDRVPVDPRALLEPARLARRKQSSSDERTRNLATLLSERGTHHLTTLDRTGNVVSLTTTVNNAFGARIVASESGVLLNDELEDFTPTRRLAGLGLPWTPNRAEPLTRPVSSMTPTIVVENGRAVLALGGSGGMAIAPNVTQVLLAQLAFGQTARAAVAAPRFFLPMDGASIEVPEGAPAELIRGLTRRGEIVKTRKLDVTAVQTIAVRGDGTAEAAADPRKYGSASAR